LRTVDGAHFCTVQAGGDLYDHVDSYRGHIDNFSFHQLKILSAYLFFFDLNLIDPKQPSKVVEVSTGDDSTPSEHEHITSDLTLPTPPEVTLPSVDLAAPVVSAPVRKVSVEDRAYANYKVGEFKTLPGGKENLLEIYDCDCPVSQLSVRLEKEGKQVVFQRTIQTASNRKQQVQRFTVPYTLSPERVEAKYNHNRDGGTLSLLLTKPDMSSAGGASGGTRSGEFTKFIIGAVAGSEGKVTMRPSQTKEFFQFEATGEPKWETEVIGELTDGEQVKFHAITTDLDASVKKKATQTFTLPAKVTLDHFELLNGGHCVKVHQKKVVTSTTTAAPAQTTQADVDIKIIVV